MRWSGRCLASYAGFSSVSAFYIALFPVSIKKTTIMTVRSERISTVQNESNLQIGSTFMPNLSEQSILQAYPLCSR